VHGSSAQLGLDQLERQGYIEYHQGAWMLTQRGAEVASQDAYNQQLWDVYRIYSDELKLPLIMEDRQKLIQEVLPDEAVIRLQRKLEGATS